MLIIKGYKRREKYVTRIFIIIYIKNLKSKSRNRVKIVEEIFVNVKITVTKVVVFNDKLNLPDVENRDNFCDFIDISCKSVQIYKTVQLNIVVSRSIGRSTYQGRTFPNSPCQACRVA